MIIDNATKNSEVLEPFNLKEHFQTLLNLLSKNQTHWTHISTDHLHKEQEQKLIQEYMHNLNTGVKIRLNNELFGLGPIEDLVHDIDVDEILIHGQDFINFERSGQLHKHSEYFLSESSFQRIFEIISYGFFKSISYENPTGNGFWNGFRVHAISPPLAKTIQISLRRIGGEKIRTLESLFNKGFINSQGLELIYKALKKKLNILICGATSSGKTTFIQCLMNQCPEDRFIILEDSEELYLPNTLSTALICPTRTEQYCISFAMKDLVKESLRMRPDRIVLGEARSDEAKDFIQALSTGHRGCIASIHAASPRDALIRLECLISQGAPNWSTPVIRQLICSGLNWVIHVEKNLQGQRVVKKISEITSLEHTGLLLHDLYVNEAN